MRYARNLCRCAMLAILSTQFYSMLALAQTTENDPYDARTLLQQFEHEPSITHVHQAALSHYEIPHAKLDRWSHRARWSNLMPQLQAQLSWLDQRDTNARHRENLSKDDDGYVFLDQVQNHHFYDARYRSLSSLRATFDLRGLVYDRHETSIARETRQSAQQREQLLLHVTNLYFDRREKQVLQLLSTEESLRDRLALELEIQALTAQLDAYTGGWFSKRLRTTEIRR